MKYYEWEKASKRLPDIVPNKRLSAKYRGELTILWCMQNFDIEGTPLFHWCFWGPCVGNGSGTGVIIKGKQWMEIEWLDESTPSQVGNELKYSYADMQACWNEAEQYGIRGNDEKGSMTLDTFLNKRTQVGNIEINSIHAECPSCGAKYDITPPTGTVVSQVGNTSGYEWKQHSDTNELPYLAKVGNTTQGEEVKDKRTILDFMGEYERADSPTTQSEGEEYNFYKQEMEKWVDICTERDTQIQALRLSNSQLVEALDNIANSVHKKGMKPTEIALRMIRVAKEALVNQALSSFNKPQA